MHIDTVVGDRLVHKPKFLAALFVAAFAVFFAINVSDTSLGISLASLIGNPVAGVAYGRGIIALILAAIFVADIAIIGFLPLRAQLIVVWLQLAVLFLAFFLVFHLSFPFILSKLRFMIVQGVVTTLYVSAIAISISFMLAIAGAIAKLSNNGFAIAIANFYTSLFRGIPLLMQVYLIYLGLPQLGYVVDAIPAGIAALSLCYGAYMTEIFRAGIESIPKGQWEASRALGFKFGLTMWRIILPQAIPVIVPPTGNQFIAMLKDSSLVSVIGVWEVMFLARTMGTKTFQHMEMLITAAMIYWILSMGLEAVQSRIEAYYRRRGAR
jgi:polar amino acid transport system permease protein